MSLPRDPVLRFLRQRFPEASIERMTGDASSRVFYRVWPAAGPSRVVMDYGQPFAGPTDDMILGAVFRAADLRVAELIEASEVNGCLLLEDLGDRDLESAIRAREAGPDDPSPLELVRAVELAADVAERGTPVLAGSERADGPALDRDRFRFEMDFFVEHYVAGFHGARAAVDELSPLLHALADRAAETPRRVLCHRDFHSRNILMPPDGTLALVDIQDARWGPDSYDLVSILRDAYIDVHDPWVEPLIDRYLARLSDPPDRAGFLDRFRTVAVQRTIKALGSFGYLTSHLGTERYLEPIPRALKRLETLLDASPDTPPLAAALRHHELLKS
jgi:hypothetical protein